MSPKVHELRLAVTAPDYDEALAFWESLNSRLEGPAGLQLTLFTELG